MRGRRRRKDGSEGGEATAREAEAKAAAKAAEKAEEVADTFVVALTEEQEATVAAAFNSGVTPGTIISENTTGVMVSCPCHRHPHRRWPHLRTFSLRLLLCPCSQLSQRGLLSLRGDTWVTDEVINSYGSLLSEASLAAARQGGTSPPIFITSTFFLPKLGLTLEEYDFEGVRDWNKQLMGLLSYSSFHVIVPYNVGNYHWAFAVLSVSKWGIQKMHFDGYGGQGSAVLNVLERWFTQYLEEIAHLPPPVMWTLGPTPTPRQTDSHSCGPACLLAMDQLRRGVKIDFEYGIFATFRKVIAFEIMAKQLILHGQTAQTDGEEAEHTEETEAARLSDEEELALATAKFSTGEQAEAMAAEAEKAKSAADAKKAEAIEEAISLKKAEPTKFQKTEEVTDQPFEIGDLVVHQGRICKLCAVHPPTDPDHPEVYYTVEVVGTGVEVQALHERLRKANDSEVASASKVS